MSLKEECVIHGLDYNKTRARILRGWSKEEAFDLVPRKQTYEVNSKEFKSFSEACKHYGLNTSTVKQRINKGWTINQAFEIKPKPKRKLKNGSSIVIKNIKYLSIREACRRLNIDRGLVNSRLRKGWTLDESFGFKPKYEIITVRNKKFKSIREVSLYYKILPETVRSRLKRNWSLEEALGLIKRKDTSKCKGRIYIIHNCVNHKKYIGLTTKHVKERFKQHVINSNNGSNTKFHKALRKIGSDKFSIKLLKRTQCRYDLARLEVKYIKKYNSIKDGYNTTIGGGCTGDRHGTQVKYDGILFKSILVLSEYLGMNRYTLRNRIARGTQIDRPIMLRRNSA